PAIRPRVVHGYRANSKKRLATRPRRCRQQPWIEFPGWKDVPDDRLTDPGIGPSGTLRRGRKAARHEALRAGCGFVPPGTRARSALVKSLSLRKTHRPHRPDPFRSKPVA